MNEEEKEERMDFDNHNIRSDWESMKALIQHMEKDLDKVLKDKGVRASVRFRNDLTKVHKMCTWIRKSVILQREDNSSQYD